MKLAIYGAPGAEKTLSMYDAAIAVILSDDDKRNIATMAPDATIYCAFFRTGEGDGTAREFGIDEVKEWLVRLKAENAWK